jgi:hypothetical protein
LLLLDTLRQRNCVAHNSPLLIISINPEPVV